MNLTLSSALSLRTLFPLVVLALVGSVHAQNEPEAPAQPVLDPNHPDRFAWELFVMLSKPANDGSNNDVVWETWASSEHVFADPDNAPVWPDEGQETVRPRALSRSLLQQDAFREFMRQRHAPDQPVPEFQLNATSVNEVRMNRAAFDYIVANELYNIEGQEKIFDTGEKVDFPVPAKEIKARWKIIDDADKPRYHWQIFEGKTYGLIALHITTKDIPIWYWSTFEHVDNPRMGAVVPSRDAFGLDPDGTLSAELEAMYASAGLGDKWKNYRLNGSQTEFTDLTGRPTLLANSVIENGFEAMSSCTTCHAMATIGSHTGPRANRLNFFPPQVGTPDPNWFTDERVNPPVRRYIQLDFVWSLFRAQRKNP